MKKAADASPNSALKREREQRCWSQLEVADRIGTTAFNVSRWERGITFPSAYFRQQLCLVFEKTPPELGLLATKDEEHAGTQSDAEEGVFAGGEVEQANDDERHEPFPSIKQEMTIADASSGPRFWNVPYRRNPFFIDRIEVLHALHTAFSADEAPAQALCGLGGIGKTQTALEYVYRHRNDYEAVLWARADTRELLMADLASIAALLTLPEKNDQDQRHAVEAVMRWLRTHQRWLLVLDNADDLAMVSEFLPATPGGHLLLTTRAQNTGQLAHPLLLEKLGQEEGAQLLLRRARLLDAQQPPSTAYWHQATAIAQAMDGLPLAIDQAAAYIEETGCGLHGYLRRYNVRSMALLRRRGGLRPDHPEPIATTWSLSFETIERTNPVAAELLRLCAFLHPDAIAEQLLTAGAIDLTSDLHLLATDPFELDSAIRDLAMFSLLRRHPETHILTLHRLVQTVLREQMDDATQRVWAERAVQTVERAFPVVSYMTWHQCQQSLAHALTCAEHIERYHITTSCALNLLNKAGSYLRIRGQYEQAEQLLTQALHSAETGVMDDPLLAESLCNLGMLAHDQGRYSEAEVLLERALALYERIWGLEHETVAHCLSALAENDLVQAQHTQMEMRVRRALAIRECVPGVEHPAIAHNLTQLAMLYHRQGNYAEAEPLYKRALTIRQQALGPEHVDVAESLNNLAYLYETLGRYVEAEPLYQQALTFCERNLGTLHMYTAISLCNLAEVYRGQECYEQAQNLHLHALAIRQQILGAEHPHVGKSLNALAEISLIQGAYAQAEELVMQSLTIWQKVLGSDHLQVSVGLDTLAEIYLKQAQYHQAERALHRSLAIQEQALGKDHPHTARNLHQQAQLYTAQSDFSRAEQFFLRAISIRQRTLPLQHPALIATLEQYTALRGAFGNILPLIVQENDVHFANVSC